MSMRKRTAFFILIIIVLLGGVCMIIIQNKTPNVKAFELNEYQYYIDNFPSDENLGSIVSLNDLLRKVERIWIEKYGEGIKKQKPYQVFYDEINDVWMVQGTLKNALNGGAAKILVDNSSGKILAIWHEK